MHNQPKKIVKKLTFSVLLTIFWLKSTAPKFPLSPGWCSAQEWCDYSGETIFCFSLLLFLLANYALQNRKKRKNNKEYTRCCCDTNTNFDANMNWHRYAKRTLCSRQWLEFNLFLCLCFSFFVCLSEIDTHKDSVFNRFLIHT